MGQNQPQSATQVQSNCAGLSERCILMRHWSGTRFQDRYGRGSSPTDPVTGGAATRSRDRVGLQERIGVSNDTLQTGET